MDAYKKDIWTLEWKGYYDTLQTMKQNQEWLFTMHSIVN